MWAIVLYNEADSMSLRKARSSRTFKGGIKHVKIASTMCFWMPPGRIASERPKPASSVLRAQASIPYANLSL